MFEYYVNESVGKGNAEEYLDYDYFKIMRSICGEIVL